MSIIEKLFSMGAFVISMMMSVAVGASDQVPNPKDPSKPLVLQNSSSVNKKSKSINVLRKKMSYENTHFLNKNSPYWEEKFMIVRGFKIGLVLAHALSFKNNDNGTFIESGPLTGWELGYAKIPKATAQGLFYLKGVGFRSRFYSLWSTFRQDPIIGSNQFNVMGIDFDFTYSLNSNFFLASGFNIPAFSFKKQLMSLDFSGRPGISMSLGFEITRDFMAEIQFSRHKVQVEQKKSYLGVDLIREYAEINYNFTNLAFTYTF